MTGTTTATTTCSKKRKKKQSLFIIRHGDRWDYNHPEWRQTATRKGDPPLSDLGHRQAYETGSFLDGILSSEFGGDCRGGVVSANDITVLSSPFLRCIETSNGIIRAFKQTDNEVDLISIRPEYSVWEMDGCDGRNHEGLPTVKERKCYFPRLDENHASLFVPTLPESRTGIIDRCERSIKELSTKYPYRPDGGAIIIVTHAAACIALVKAASGAPLDQINPAGPCSVYRLDRTDESETWDLDPPCVVGGMNGHVDHLSDMGTKTVPWNNFGEKGQYTGPLMN